ncbi:MAG: DeoR/GlpR family DNA-binding transcription regulator [Actinomycetota bacterium]|nr:DeoR/GlpR family DNA-binding transcription regulator [Actinomycetota bacterium]
MARYESDVMNAVALRGSVSVRELAMLLNVSEQTVRRIVKPLVERGEIEKVHGAVVGRTRPGEAPFLARMSVNQRAKVAIAARVATLVRDGDVIALDTGSTTGFIAQALRQHRGLTVVTNSTFIAASLATIAGNKVLMAGVELRNHDGASFDAQAFAVVRSMQVRLAILSASALDERRGLMVQEHAEAEMSAAMGEVAEQRVFAVDSSKFGRHALVALPRFGAGDLLVTDTAPSAAQRRPLGDGSVMVIG